MQEVNPNPAAGVARSVELRPPVVKDGAQIHQFISQHGGVELNTAYAYLLLCERFASRSIVAERDGEVVGFVVGLSSPERPDVLFVWQVAVSPKARRQNLAARMLDGLLERLKPSALEAHVGEGNEASEALFRAVGRRHGANVTVTRGFDETCFIDPHPPERLFHIGPFSWRKE